MAKVLRGYTVRQVIDALESASKNTDTDPRWKAAQELRWLEAYGDLIYLEDK